MVEEARREQLLSIYAQTRTIAVVGASADASKAAHQVPFERVEWLSRIMLLTSCQAAADDADSATIRWKHLD